MDWGTFGTIILQGMIVLIILFFVAAAASVVYNNFKDKE